MRNIMSLVVLALFTVFLSSCEQVKVAHAVGGDEPLFEDAVLIVKSGSDVRLSAPITENYTNESPQRYLMRNTFSGFSAKFPEVTVECQYIGRAVVGQASKVDVYLVSLEIGDGVAEHVPVVYAGDDKVVIEHEGITISLTQSVAEK